MVDAFGGGGGGGVGLGWGRRGDGGGDVQGHGAFVVRDVSGGGGCDGGVLFVFLGGVGWFPNGGAVVGWDVGLFDHGGGEALFGAGPQARRDHVCLALERHGGVVAVVELGVVVGFGAGADSLVSPSAQADKRDARDDEEEGNHADHDADNDGDSRARLCVLLVETCRVDNLDWFIGKDGVAQAEEGTRGGLLTAAGFYSSKVWGC